MSETEFVRVDRQDHVVSLTLNRPDSLNAISGALAKELATRCGEVAEDQDVWIVVLRAEGERAFCVGADLKE